MYWRAIGDNTGHGQAYAHHGELLQGVFADDSGHLHRGLVTLPSTLFHTEATFTAQLGAAVTIDPPGNLKALRAARLTLNYCHQAAYGGVLRINSNIPCKIGLGSSTSDVCATICAVAQAFACTLTPEEVAQLAVQAEQASDSLMFDPQHPVLFAHREGRILEDFHAFFPPLEIVGFNTDNSGEGVDTLNLAPASYSWQEIELFRVIRAGFRKAILLQDASLLGRVATASASINQRYLPKPHFDQLLRLARRVGALGIQVAHSGTVASLLFDPIIANLVDRIETVQAYLLEMGFTLFPRFCIGKEILLREYV